MVMGFTWCMLAKMFWVWGRMAQMCHMHKLQAARGELTGAGAVAGVPMGTASGAAPHGWCGWYSICDRQRCRVRLKLMRKPVLTVLQANMSSSQSADTETHFWSIEGAASTSSGRGHISNDVQNGFNSQASCGTAYESESDVSVCESNRKYNDPYSL